MANSIGTKGLLPLLCGVLGVGSALAADQGDAANGADAAQVTAGENEVQEVQ